jgi:hypothetical protein
MFILSQEGVNAIKKEKAKLMQDLGFVNAGNVEEVRAQEYKRSSAELNANIVNKYKQKYPQYKFIFKDQVREICKKYGLLCGEASLYKGDIPLKNLKEIEEFKVSDEDKYYMLYYSTIRAIDVNRVLQDDFTSVESFADLAEKKRREQKIKGTMSYYEYTMRIPFFICAPKSDMKIEGYKTEGVFLKREIPDPIVLHYVKDGFLIVTKWGIEGDDPIVND